MRGKSLAKEASGGAIQAGGDILISQNEPPQAKKNPGMGAATRSESHLGQNTQLTIESVDNKQG